MTNYQKRKKEIEELRSQLIKLQNGILEERRREDEARRRSDMIIAHLSRQLEQQTILLDYHREPWWKRWFKKEKPSQATKDFYNDTT